LLPFAPDPDGYFIQRMMYIYMAQTHGKSYNDPWSV